MKFGSDVFRPSWRTISPIKYLVSYQYDTKRLIELLDQNLGETTVGELHARRPDFHMVITATDIYANTTRFIKLYKQRYHDWRLSDIVMASSVVPTVFPVYEHEYRKLPTDPEEEQWIPETRYWVDGGVGSYSNPCYMAAYEIAFCLHDHGWTLDNTTLISIGTGNSPLQRVWQDRLRGLLGGMRTPRQFLGPEWVFPTVDTFLTDAAHQQVMLTRHFFTEAVAARAGNPDAGLDFRRFNITFDSPIEMDDTRAIPELSDKYGVRLGEMIINNEEESIDGFSCGGAELFRSISPGKPEAQAI